VRQGWKETAAKGGGGWGLDWKWIEDVYLDGDPAGWWGRELAVRLAEEVVILTFKKGETDRIYWRGMTTCGFIEITALWAREDAYAHGENGLPTVELCVYLRDGCGVCTSGVHIVTECRWSPRRTVALAFGVYSIYFLPLRRQHGLLLPAPRPLRVVAQAEAAHAAPRAFVRWALFAEAPHRLLVPLRIVVLQPCLRHRCRLGTSHVPLLP
jgi:hypothetical protein